MPRDYFLIKKPLLTEKSTALNTLGKYTFVVEPEATKNEIRKAVKELYKVDVLNVNILNTQAKKRRFRNLISRKGGYKKAIVTLKAGQKINPT
ncbi:MAG: 50S ribosomal protein L23 [Candidatus Liptonbacteria bacterium]|nr:50S ribosomal protein L23 [Candidatus Liptonbacteria bacterium]